MDFTAGIFEHDVAFDEQARVGARQAAAVAHKRASDRFGSFLSQATDADLHQRFALVEDELAELVADAVEEYGGDAERVLASVTSVLAAGGFCDDCRKWKSGPKKGCECGSNETSEAQSSDEPSEDSGTTAKVAHWTIVSEALETVKLPTGDETALDGPSPKIDKKTWKPNALNEEGNLSPIDTEGAGSPNPTVHQDIYNVPDHSKEPLAQTDAVTESQDVGKEKDIDRIHTDTWHGTDGLAKPVTSAAQDVERNPLRTMMQQGLIPRTTVEAAISAYETPA